MFDFVFHENQMIQLVQQCKSLSVYDHHKGKEDVMQAFSSNCHFDNAHSAAYLAYKYFFPQSDSVPKFVRFIQDRDLWLWELPGSRAFSAYSFTSLPFDFDLWYEVFVTKGKQCFIQDDDPKYQDMITQGSYILALQDRLVQSCLYEYRIIPILGNIQCAIINSRQFKSEIGEKILEKKKEVDAVIIWHHDHAKKRIDCSVRTRMNGPILAYTIAQQFGGSGHEDAAGFKIQNVQDSCIETILQRLK